VNMQSDSWSSGSDSDSDWEMSQSGSDDSDSDNICWCELLLYEFGEFDSFTMNDRHFLITALYQTVRLDSCDRNLVAH